MDSKQEADCPFHNAPYVPILKEPGVTISIVNTDGKRTLNTDIAGFGFVNAHINACPMCGFKFPEQYKKTRTI